MPTSPSVYCLPMQYGPSPSSFDMYSQPRMILLSWRSIHSWLCCSGGRMRSRKISAAASQMPSARDAQRLVSARSRFDSGISLLFGATLSMYSTMTLESKSTVESSSSSTGILPSGLMLGTPELASHGESSTNSQSIFFSARTTRTLRTKGLVKVPISFICLFVYLRNGINVTDCNTGIGVRIPASRQYPHVRP